MSEEHIRKSLQDTNTTESSHCNKRIEDAKATIDNMILRISEKISLERDTIGKSTFRGGALELEDGTVVSYHDRVENGKVQDTNLSIYIKDSESTWEICGAQERYQISNTKFDVEKDEVVASITQQYNGMMVISIDNINFMEVTQNEIIGFETINTDDFSSSQSVFLRKGDNIEYKGEYDDATIRRAIYDIQGTNQMQAQNGIYIAQQSNELNQLRELLGFKLPKVKSDEEIQELLHAREEILQRCNPLLNNAQQVVDATLEKIKEEKSINIKAEKGFGKMLGSKSLPELQQENQKLKVEETALYNEYSQIVNEKDEKNEL